MEWHKEGTLPQLPLLLWRSKWMLIFHRWLNIVSFLRCCHPCSNLWLPKQVRSSWIKHRPSSVNSTQLQHGWSNMPVISWPLSTPICPTHHFNSQRCWQIASDPSFVHSWRSHRWTRAMFISTYLEPEPCLKNSWESRESRATPTSTTSFQSSSRPTVYFTRRRPRSSMLWTARCRLWTSVMLAHPCS